MADDRKPAYNISLNKALKQGGFYGANGIWNSLVKVDGRVLRGRVEVLVLKKDQQQIFMHIKSYNKKKYRVPGGSYEKDVPNYIQAQNEVNEEARIKVKGLVNSGEHYVNLYKNPTPLYGSNFMWVGNYTEVYVGEYDGKYDGFVAEEDKDEDMYNKGKFYNISEVYPILNDTHRKIIDSIFPSLDKGSINENMIILRESNSKPHYYPYYTPFEMSKLGVFNENSNRYSDIEDEAIEWYLEYTDSLRNPDSENWLKELQDRYDNYIKESTDENKQLILDLGWNPEVPVTMENVLIASSKTKGRLKESTDEKLVLDEGLIFSGKDIALNIDDFESGKSNILFITGLAGSGKTTLAETLEKQYGAEVVSLDYFQHETSFYHGEFKEFKDTTSYKIVEKYMKENPDIEKERYSFNNINLDEFSEYFVPFFGWLVNTLRKDKGKKYIVEGIHILLFIPYKEVKGYPLYCVNTSAIKSLVRHWKRDDWTIEDIIKNGYGDLLKFKDWNDQYNRFKNSMNESLLYKVSYYTTPDKDKNNVAKLKHNFRSNKTIQDSILDYLSSYESGDNDIDMEINFNKKTVKDNSAYKKEKNRKVVVYQLEKKEVSVVDSGTVDELCKKYNIRISNEATIYDPISGGEVKSPFVENDFVYTADMIKNKLKKYHQEGKYTCIECRDIDSDDGGWVFAKYTTISDKKKDELDVVNFINEINNWINNSILVGEVEMPAYIKDEGFLILKDVKGFLGESALLQESKSGKYYRVTYNGVGIYQALKERTTQEQWKLLLQDPAITWLPKPPEYAEGMISYFTEYGYKMFEMHTYPLIEKYFDEDVLVVPLRSLDEDIIYKDKYQVVVNTSLNETCKNVDEARKFVMAVDKLAKKYDANYFIVTDGASGTRNGIYGDKKPNSAVANARNAQKEWEKENGFDPDEDWIKESSYFPNTDIMESNVYNNGEYLEERGTNSMKPLFDLYNDISNNEYGIVYNGKVITGDDIDYGKQYRTISVKDFEKYRAGVCWDFARYQEYMLKKSYSDVQNYYIVLDFAPNYPTHTITVVKIKNKYYYIEVSWERYKGIYEANKLSDILNCVASRQIEFVNAPHDVRLECRKYTDNDKLVGMNAVEYMDYMNNQKKITIYPQKADESKLTRIDAIIESANTDDKEYGLPELKKYPMPDEKHVLSAIRFFNYVSPANEEELARNIKKKMKQYDIPPSKVGDKNRLKKYLKEDVDLIQELMYYCIDERCKPVLVFDLGSVLIDSKVGYLESLYKSSLIPNNLAQEIHDYIMDTFKDNSEYLSYCTTSEYYKFMTDKAPDNLKKYIPAAISINIKSLKKLPYADSLLKRLKERGYTLCYLSNWDKWSRDELVKNGSFDFLKYFDTGIFSCDVKCSKPDHKIYEKFFEICDKVPNSCIFFDDRADNIKAAMEVGMYGILFNKDYTPQWICDTFLSGELIEEMSTPLRESTTYDIEKTRDTYMIKNEKGQIMSKIRYFDYRMKNFDWVLIADVETNPSYRKMGLASKLLNEVYKDVRKESNSKKGIYVFVKQNNKNAINLYKKLKFTIIREYKLSDGDYLIMAKGSANKKQFNNMNFK